MCVSENGSDGLCTDGTALTRRLERHRSRPTGSQVFVTAAAIGGVTAYARDAATGRLTPQSCLLDRAPRGGLVHYGAGAGGRGGERDQAPTARPSSWPAETDGRSRCSPATRRPAR